LDVEVQVWLRRVPGVATETQEITCSNALSRSHAQASALQVREQRKLAVPEVEDDMVPCRVAPVLEFHLRAVVSHSVAGGDDHSIGGGDDGATPSPVVRVPSARAAVGAA